MSIEHKLPLAVSILLAVLLALYVWVTYREVEETSAEVAGQRLEAVAVQLAELVKSGAVTRDANVRRLLGSPAIDEALTTGTATDSVRRLLARVRGSSDSNLPVYLLDPTQRVVLRIGNEATDSALSQRGRVIGTAVELDTIGAVGRFFWENDRPRYWFVFPIRRGDRLIGYAASLRVVSAAAASEALLRLIGQDMGVMFTNATGPREPLFTLEGEKIAAPGRSDLEVGTHSHTRGDERYLAHFLPLPNTPWAVLTETPQDYVHARAVQFVRRTGVMALAIIVVGALIAWMVSRRYTKPMRELSRAAADIGEGRYDRRVDSERSDELGTLARTFNRMAEQVQSGVRETEKSRIEAEAANRTKSEFLANMSHEIRTPINAMLGYTDLLELGISGPVTEEQRSQLERIRVSGTHLTRLIDDLLDFARLETGRLSVHRETAPASNAVRTALTVIEPAAAAKPVQLDVDCDGDVQFIGDPQRVEQILVNLLSNAVKFTQPGGRVVLRCETIDAGASQRTRFIVEDTGIGIAPEQMKNVFEPFVQGHTGYTRAHGGSGLGLAISRRLAEMMGGEITADSAVGVGSSFVLSLPAPASTPASVQGD